MLDLEPDGVNGIIQVTDLKDMPKRERGRRPRRFYRYFRIIIQKWWRGSLVYSMFSPFLTQRTKAKFVISKEGNAAETLYNLWMGE